MNPNNKRQDNLILFRGAGELASGAIRRLSLAGFPVVALEMSQPLCVRRTVSFASAVFDREITVEGVTGKLCPDAATALETASEGRVSVLVDPEAKSLEILKPTILVDARMAKVNLGTSAGDAPTVIALGPGFTAPTDAHYVIETARGHDLGRVITNGSATPDTGIPGNIGGETVNRLLRAPSAGIFRAVRNPGDIVDEGDIVGRVGDEPVVARITGLLRGLIHDGVPVEVGVKVGDVDPRTDPSFLHSVSDKANAVAGGVLEAVLRGLP